jgi:FAD/FMN-containing dehydrogenase
VRRRDFLKALSAAPFLASAPALAQSRGVLVNDAHTGLNPTWVERVERPASVAEIQQLLKDSRKHGKQVSLCGSRHATGGQQFAANSVLFDMRGMKRVVNLDEKTGILNVESGIEWPELIRGYLGAQKDTPAWGIRQKQGGGDHMSLGGALSANAHGHCLGAPPIIADIEWIDVVASDGAVKRCSRKENTELFSVAIGGYGLFGIITSVGLRLIPRRKVRRRVETQTTAEMLHIIEKRAAAGAPFGYFQYSVDETSLEFTRTGILTTYELTADDAPVSERSGDVDEETLLTLLEIAHKNRRSAYARYAKLELSRDGSVEWSDLHQLSNYPPGYHKTIEKNLGLDSQGADLIWEFYVPHSELIGFLEDARRVFLKSGAPLIYGTVRFIEQDRDSFLAWAKKRSACVIFSPHISGGAPAMKKAGELCRQLLQSATKRNGSFYLTYNRFATRAEMDAAYPQFAEFLQLKKKYDPTEIFQSEWYRHYKDLYA